MKSKKILLCSAILSGAISPGILADDALVFNGYARWGFHSQLNNPKLESQVGHEYKFVETDSDFGSSVGRLGNETNGGEIQLTKYLTSSSGAKWDVGFMLEQYSDSSEEWDPNIKKLYAGVRNIIPSQPNAYFWGGLNHNMRYQTYLTNYFIYETDGQGGGVRDLDVGIADLDLSVVAAASYTGAHDRDGLMAATSDLHGIHLNADFYLDLFMNYGFDTTETTADTHIQAQQYGLRLHHEGWDWNNRVTAMYSTNNVNSVFKKAEEVDAVQVYFEGDYTFTPSIALAYLAAYHNVENTGTNTDEHFASRTSGNVVLRPMFFWNEDHSTWFETGYENVDYDGNGEDTAWKITVSQNISFGARSKARPMLRAYVTYGQVDKRLEAKYDVASAGIMFEGWW
ncbi:maltoporin [Vibrio inusitatus NBRC 102082]|uniref:Maltoporin n=1 Tax=Vibrio inusitatus NBRC 102082 TaxID=1219070 RepID=A0A4Y3HUD2_9VIBR|nr:carbohydrate porin [Vibrio inusitatus]GEA49894.1 maltoporin [Vibrio inusitatus NBRC 102082]